MAQTCNCKCVFQLGVAKIPNDVTGDQTNQNSAQEKKAFLILGIIEKYEFKMDQDEMRCSGLVKAATQTRVMV